ncbi:MAG: hypothetical protein J0J15_34220 [Mesorhizobium sp.]|nr:hypothetical protein [Mesorhizobium sp.]
MPAIAAPETHQHLVVPGLTAAGAACVMPMHEIANLTGIDAEASASPAPVETPSILHRAGSNFRIKVKFWHACLLITLIL